MKKLAAWIIILAMLLTAAAADTAIRVPPIEQHTLAVDPITQNAASPAGAEILTFDGEITQDGQKDSHWFDQPFRGRCRVEIGRMAAGTAVTLEVWDAQGSRIDSCTYCTNGKGLTLKDLPAGSYEARVIQESGASAYSLAVGLQKETADISGLTLLTDSVEYTDQRNVYSFTVPRDGLYRFEFARMMSGLGVDLYVFNDLNELVDSYTYCTNGKGLTLKDLKAGEVYEVQVRQNSDTGSYNLLIGLQKETIPVQRNSSIEDSIEYTDQRNVYSFVPDASGSVTLELGGVQSGIGFDLYAFDDLGALIDSRTYAVNGSTLTLNDLQAGVRYGIQVRQNSGAGDYTLFIY